MEHGLLFNVVLDLLLQDHVMICQSFNSVLVDLNFELHTWENLLSRYLEILELLNHTCMAFLLRQAS